jgi:hypothetical protein
MEEVLEVVERVRPSRAVFDAIAELRLLATDPTRFQQQIFALRELFANSGATVIFLDTQPQLRGTRELEHIAQAGRVDAYPGGVCGYPAARARRTAISGGRPSAPTEAHRLKRIDRA